MDKNSIEYEEKRAKARITEIKSKNKYREIRNERKRILRKNWTPEQKEHERLKQRKCQSKSARNWLIKTLNNCKGMSKKKGYEFDLDIDFLMEVYQKQKGQCNLTNICMSWEFESPYAISIDRIDSNLGYIKTNVQLVVQFANYAKNDFSNEKIKELIQVIRNK